MQCHKGCTLEHPLRAMSLVSWGVERLTRFSLSLYLFRVIWLNVYKVLLCLHCWGITTIRCPSMLAYGLANNNLVSSVPYYSYTVIGYISTPVCDVVCTGQVHIVLGQESYKPQERCIRRYQRICTR